MQSALKVAVLGVLLYSSVVSAGEFIEMENLFIRTTGKPQEDSFDFGVYNPDQQFFIRVQNGPEGYKRISSASVSFLLNDQEIFDSDDFNQQVEWLEKEVSLVAENTIRVLLTSIPDAGIKIFIYGVDEEVPILTFTAPEENAILATNTPAISLSYSDIYSGVVTSTLQVMVNGEDRTGLFAIGSNDASWTVPEDLALPEGEIVCAAQITDRGHNTGTAERRFTVDVTPPHIVFIEPEEGAMLGTATPTITLSYSDAVTGVDETTQQVIVNGEDRSALFQKNGSGASWTIPEDQALPEGQIIAVASISDAAGNSGETQLQFTVDITPPQMSFERPTAGTTIDNNTPYIKVAYSDAISGVDASTVQVLLSGVDVTDNFTIDGDSAVHQVLPAGALPDGNHKLVLSVSDNTGNVAIDSIGFLVQTSRLKALPEAFPDSGLAPLTVRFKTYGECSHSTINWYRWDFEGDGTWNSTTQVASDYTYIFNQPGIYFASLEVTNMLGEKDTGTIRIVVTGPPPQAYANAGPSNGAAPLEVRFSGWGEKESGYIKYHEWDLDADGDYETMYRLVADSVTLFENTFEESSQGWECGGESGNICLAHDGERSGGAYTDYVLSTNAGQYYNNYMDAWNLSPVIHLPSAEPCSLSYWQYFYSESCCDIGYVEVSSNGGGFSTVQSFRGNLGESQIVIDLSSYAGTDIRIRFRFYSDYSVVYPGWRLDDILVFSQDGDARTILLADNGNGDVVWEQNPSGDTFVRITSGKEPEVADGHRWIEADTGSYMYENDMNCWITSPQFSLPSLSSDEQLRLMFHHLMVTADQGDGGFVEISVDDGAFQPISPVGGYPGVITDVGAGYTGILLSDIASFDLTQYAGNTVQFRFSFVSDASGVERGWLIDNVCLRHIFPPTVVPHNTVMYSCNFEEGIGDVAVSGNPADGWGLDSVNLSTVDSVWATNSGTNYYNNMNAWILSPPIELPVNEACSLSYWQTFNCEGYYDHGHVEIDPGTGLFTQLLYFSGSYGESTQKVDLTAFAGQTVRLRFRFYTDYSVVRTGWQVDNMVVFSNDGTSRTVLFEDDVKDEDLWTRNTSGYQWLHKLKSSAEIKGTGKYWLSCSPFESIYPNNAQCWAEIPEVQLHGAHIEMSYTQYFNCEYGYDGGWLEISLDGGSTYSKIFPATGYNGTLWANGEQVFTGNAGTSMPRFDLTQFTGFSARIRFMFSSNSSNNTGKWVVDDILISDTEDAVTYVTNNYGTPGTYSAAFRVTDNEGQTAVTRSSATVIEVGPEGTPTVISNAEPREGVAPFNVNFIAAAIDNGGTVMLYEWDFDGDDVYDWSSTENGNVSHVYTRGGSYVATCRVTDNDGLTSRQYFDISVNISASLAISDYDRTFIPDNSETIGIQSYVSGDAPINLYIKDEDGQIVRTLVDWQERNAGSYNDIWDGRDDLGNPVSRNRAYYAVLDYRIGNDVRSIDPTNSTGGGQYNPSRQLRYNYTVRPYHNVHLPLTFTISRPSEVTLFMGLLWGADMRLRTILNRVPFGAGTYTVYWDGLADDGSIPSEHSGDIIPGIWGYYLPDNAIWVKADIPELSGVTTTPSNFVPMSQTCGSNGEENGITIGYSVSSNAPKVAMKVFSVATGNVIVEKEWANVAAGSHNFFWDGKDDEGRFLDRGSYRIGLCIGDEYGNTGMFSYNLMKTLHYYRVSGE